MIQEMKEESQKADIRFEKMIQDMNRKWGDLVNKMGTLAEDIVAPGFPSLIEKYFGLPIDDITVWRKVKDKEGNIWKFEVIAKGGNFAFIVDIKSEYDNAKYLEKFQKKILPKAQELLHDLEGFFLETTQDSSLRRKMKKFEKHAYTWRKNPRVWREDLIFLSFSTQHLNLSTTQHFGVSILTWCHNVA